MAQKAIEDIILEFNGNIVFSNKITTKKGFLIVYIVRHRNSKNRLSSITVNYYTTENIRPYSNGSRVKIKGELLENYYKDKNNNYISKGLVINAISIGI